MNDLFSNESQKRIDLHFDTNKVKNNKILFNSIELHSCFDIEQCTTSNCNFYVLIDFNGISRCILRIAKIMTQCPQTASFILISTLFSAPGREYTRFAIGDPTVAVSRRWSRWSIFRGSTDARTHARMHASIRGSISRLHARLAVACVGDPPRLQPPMHARCTRRATCTCVRDSR